MGRKWDFCFRTPSITSLGLQGFVSSLVFCSWISLGLPYHTLDAIDGYRRRKIDGVSDKFSYWMSKGSSNLVEVLERS
ncbi:hypothetical protein Tco_1508181 [Tanacetum coccineum]